MEQISQRLTNELRQRRINVLNKIILGAFLFIAIGVFLMRIVDGILIDYGFGVDKLMHENWSNYKNMGYTFIHDWDNPSNINVFHKDFWNDSDVVFLAKQTKNVGSHIAIGSKGNGWAIPALHNMVARHPNTFWMLTQFTWLTTIIVVIFLTLRLFEFESRVPSWLRWVMSQRTLSLVSMYDTIVCVGYWSAMFSTFTDTFTPGLEILEYFITIIVHGVIPVAILTYSFIYLIKDKKASILKETFVLRGIMYPFIYALYYILIATIWNDPYTISNLKYNFDENIWKLPLALLVLWIMLGLFLLLHNFVLIHFNKKYDPRNDYEVIRRRDAKIEKLKRRTTQKVEKQYQNKYK